MFLSPLNVFQAPTDTNQHSRGVNELLARMKFDYIDLFLIHDPLSGTDRRLDTYKALIEAKAAGKIRSVGVSN